MKYIKINLGQKFNKLKTIKLDHCKKTPMKNGYFRTKEYYLCQCDCGNFTIVEKGNLTSGHTQSCGCHKIKTSIENGKNKKLMECQKVEFLIYGMELKTDALIKMIKRNLVFMAVVV